MLWPVPLLPALSVWLRGAVKHLRVLARRSRDVCSAGRISGKRLPQSAGESAGGHRTIEGTRNHSGWKGPLRSSGPTVNPMPPCPLNHVPTCNIYRVFECLQGWWSNHLPGKPVPALDNPFGEDNFPDIRAKPPLAQLADGNRRLPASLKRRSVDYAACRASFAVTWEN